MSTTTDDKTTSSPPRWMRLQAESASKPQRRASVRAIRAAGIAATALAGALVVTAPQAVPPGSVAVALTSSDSYQDALDHLLDEMQQAVAHDAALPYAPDGSEDELLTILQNTNYQLLMSGISRVTELFNGWFFQSPEAVAGDAADPRQYFNFFTPDIYYHVTAGLAPDATYELTGTLGGGTQELSISAEAITGASAETTDSLQITDDDFQLNPDGTFTVVIGPENLGDAANFIDDTDATTQGAASLLIRDMLGNWAQGPSSLSIHCVSDCPPFFAIPDTGLLPGSGGTDLSDTNIDSVDSVLKLLFNAFAGIVGPFNEMGMANGKTAGIEEDPNTMSDLSPETDFGAGLPSAEVSAGHFDLDAGEALVVKMPDVEAAYSGIELMNPFGAALPYTMAQTTFNNTTAFHDPDGYTYYVISATNPGVANWLDSGDVTEGEIFARFEGVTDPSDAEGLGVATQLVPVDEVADYLPTDTPTVSAEEYAADMAQRVFSYDYALDVSRMNAQPDWLIQQSLLHGLQGLMGGDDYESVFGSEPVTPLALRFTDALSPDFDTVTHDLFAHPVESLSAVFNNLPLLFSDINLPIQWAMIQPVLELLLPEGQSLADVFHDAWFDPNAGIIAGFLNARDDFATAILTANDDFPSELGQQAAQQWADMPDLIESTPSMGLADLGTVFSDFFGG
jgi:hypothetical protein